MKKFLPLALIGLAIPLLSVPAATTIDPAHPYAYGANIGWVNARGDVANGAKIGRFYCGGSLWGANVGWIALGAGAPTNGWQFGNTAANDWGVNHDGLGYLRGYAYGANIGWIHFETNGNPKVDLLTGALSGYAWSANVGWIGLSNLFASVRTETLDPGPDTDGDGIPDAWEMKEVGVLVLLDDGDNDHDNDKVTDLDEYGADTDPDDVSSFLRITDYAHALTTNTLTWLVEPTRLYRLETATAVSNTATWVDSGHGVLAPGPGPILTRAVPDSATTTKFFRAKAIVPLAP